MSIEEKRVKFAQTMRVQFEDQDLQTITNPEAIKTYIKDQEDLLEAYSSKKKPTPDIMGVTRASCSLCIRSCECYEPLEVFLLELSENSYSNTFIPTLCRNCKCPAYFHPPVQKELNFPRDLKEGLRNTILKEDYLNFSGTLAVFSVNFNELDRVGGNLKEQEDSLYDLLKHGGFSVICRSMKVLDSEEKQKIFLTSQNLPNNFFSAVVQMAGPKTSTNFNKSKIQTSWVKQDEPLLILCLSSAYVNSQAQFCKFMQAAVKYLPRVFRCEYGSMNSTQGFTDCSIFFPEVFTVKNFCVIVPTETQAKLPSEIDPIMSFFKTQSLRIKGKMLDDDKDVNLQRLGKILDQLSYNGFSVSLNQEKKVNQITEMQEVFEKFLTVNRAEFLSKFVMANANDFKVNVVAAGKVGIPMMITLPGQSMDSFTFTNEKDIFHLYSYFCPNMVTSSRTLLIFRPIAVRSGLNKIFLNVFRRNHFSVLCEEYRKLSQSEIRLIQQNSLINLDDLLELMLEGEVHIAAVSKLAGFEEAKILSDGCQFGRRRSEKRLLQTREFTISHQKQRNPFNMKLDSDIGLEQSDSNFMHEQVRVTHNLEEGTLFTLSPFSSVIESLDLDSIVDKQLQSMKHELDLPNFQLKQQQINRLRFFSRHFNIALHTSASLQSSEKEILHFFPHLGLYSDVILVMKPEAIALEKDFFRLMDCMKCKVFRAVTHEGRNYYCVVKLAGREEFTGLFEYKVAVNSILFPHNLSLLFDLHVLPTEFEPDLDLILPQVKNLSYIDLPNSPDEVLQELLRYMLLVTSFEDLDNKGIEWVYLYPEFLHFAVKVNTAQRTCKELRVRKLQYLFSQDPIVQSLELYDEYSVISWFYHQISKYFPRIVPEFYWFKIEPADKQQHVTRVFSCCEFKGHVFLKPIWQMMQDHRNREVKKNKDRGSVITFMWGRKLALLVERIEILDASSISDFGPIYWNGKGEYLGYYSGDTNLFDCKKYKMYLEQLRAGWDEYADIETLTEILKKFRIIIESQAFIESRKRENLGLVPDLVEFINLRVFSYKEKPNIEEIHYIDKKLAAMNELYGKTLQEMDVYDFALLDTFPAKYPKRHMASNVIWLLSVYLKYFDSKEKELETSKEEYLIFLESLKQGFLNNYEGDSGVQGISLLQLEYFLFSLSQAWKLYIEIVEVQNKMGNVELSRSESYAELQKLRLEEDKISRNLTVQLREMADIDLNFKIKAGEEEFLKIDRERYFMHYMMKEYEPNLKNARYPNHIIKAKFPVINPVIEQYIKGGLSDVQKAWFNPISPKKQNLRPAPKSAFRFDSILVKTTKWMTHQRLRKLVKDAMMYLTQTATSVNNYGRN